MWAYAGVACDWNRLPHWAQVPQCVCRLRWLVLPEGYSQPGLHLRVCGPQGCGRLLALGELPNFISMCRMSDEMHRILRDIVLSIETMCIQEHLYWDACNIVHLVHHALRFIIACRWWPSTTTRRTGLWSASSTPCSTPSLARR